MTSSQSVRLNLSKSIDVRLGLACISCVLAIFWATGCGEGNPGDGTGSTATTPGSEAAASAGSNDRGSAIFTQSARLRKGATTRLLSTPVATVRVTCEDETVNVIVTEKRTAANVVVASFEGKTIQPQLQRGETLAVPMSVPDIQTWSISPFGNTRVRSTTITVAARALEPSTIYECAVVAQAIIGGARRPINR